MTFYLHHADEVVHGRDGGQRQPRGLREIEAHELAAASEVKQKN